MCADPKRRGIACAGNWILDLVKVVDVYPPQNALANILSESCGGGGCAHNVSLNLAKFDPQLDVYAMGVIGDDSNGDTLLAECRQFPNIHSDQLNRVSQERTSYTDVFNVKSTGCRTFFHWRGANRCFSPSYVDLDRLPVDMFHLGYLLLLDSMDQPDAKYVTVAAAFLHEVQRRGIQTSIDLVSEDSDRFNKIVPAALKYTNFCIINDFEAEKFSGLPIRCGSTILIQNLRRIGENCFAHGVHDLVVIHFPEGSYLLGADGTEIIQPSLELPESYIVGSTGAGDSFCAGMIYGLYKHWSPAESLRFATCAGAMNLSDLTTVGGIRTWQEILEIQKRFPYRKALAV
jgi:sugar/nucleoside kinase (ribokinase family)